MTNNFTRILITDDSLYLSSLPSVLHQILKISLIALFVSTCFCSCKSYYTIYKEPSKPKEIVLDGNCLVNRLTLTFPLKKEEEMMNIVLNQLTKIEGVGFTYLPFLTTDSVINSQIDFVPQPDIMDRIFKELNYKYLINVSIDANQYKKGSLAWKIITWELSLQVTAKIAVYETETSRMVYQQEVVLTEEWPTVSDDWGDEKRRNFILTYSTENLMKKAIIKSATDLKRSANGALGLNEDEEESDN